MDSITAIGLVLGIGALVLIGLGRGAEGIAIVLGELAVFGGVFVYGKREQKKELQQKRASAAPNVAERG